MTEVDGTSPGHTEGGWKLTEGLPAARKIDKVDGIYPGGTES